MKLYVMRHCERDMNNCSFESPLIDVGHIKAQHLCDTIESFKITTLISSPFLRTIQTGHYYSKKKNIPIYIDYSLCEFLNINKSDMYSSNNYIIPYEWKNTYNIDKTIMIKNDYNINENFKMCVERVYNFLEYIKKKYNDTDENILLITHMSIVNIIIAITRNNLNERFNISKYYPMGLITKI